MLVNISRSKFLINKTRSPQLNKKLGGVAKCNHCGGAFKNSGDMAACIMCSRELGHICGNCAHAVAGSVTKNKESI